MGLDITAYETIERAPELDGEDDPYDQGGTRLYRHPGFEKQADDVVDGVYRCTGKSLCFRAGSYSGYNAWRDDLARMVGTTAESVWKAPPADLPFVELINFADSEGVIGPITSAALAADFDEWAERALAFATSEPDAADGAWFLSLYEQWRAAFRLAAGSGAVDFH